MSASKPYRISLDYEALEKRTADTTAREKELTTQLAVISHEKQQIEEAKTAELKQAFNTNKATLLDSVDSLLEIARVHKGKEEQIEVLKKIRGILREVKILCEGMEKKVHGEEGFVHWEGEVDDVRDEMGGRPLQAYSRSALGDLSITTSRPSLPHNIGISNKSPPHHQQRTIQARDILNVSSTNPPQPQALALSTLHKVNPAAKISKPASRKPTITKLILKTNNSNQNITGKSAPDDNKRNDSSGSPRQQHEYLTNEEMSHEESVLRIRELRSKKVVEKNIVVKADPLEKTGGLEGRKMIRRCL